MYRHAHVHVIDCTHCKIGNPRPISLLVSYWATLPLLFYLLVYIKKFCNIFNVVNKFDI